MALQQRCPDVGVLSRGGEVMAKCLFVVLCVQHLGDGPLSADSDAIFVFVSLSPGLPGLRIV